MQRRKVNKPVLFFLIIFIMFNAFTFRLIIGKFNVNPYLVAIEDILQREVDERFWIGMEFDRNELIQEIYIYGHGVYLQPDIFSKVDKAQRLIYTYIMEHKEAFEFYTSDIEEYKFVIFFVTRSYDVRNPNVKPKFTFAAVESDSEWLGFNDMKISGFTDISDIYKFSNMTHFKYIRNLKCEWISIDSTDILDEMKNLKRIDLVEGIYGDIAGLRQKAESLGIEINGYEDVENMKDEEKEPKIQWNYDRELSAGDPSYWMK